VAEVVAVSRCCTSWLGWLPGVLVLVANVTEGEAQFQLYCGIPTYILSCDALRVPCLVSREIGNVAHCTHFGADAVFQGVAIISTPGPLLSAKSRLTFG